MGTSPQSREATYVAYDYKTVLEAYLDRDPSLIKKIIMVGVLLLVVAFLFGPLIEPVRHRLGPYLYVHIGFLIVTLFWFFFWFLRPPNRANDRMCRRFMRKLRDEKLRQLGLDTGAISATKIAIDGDTLEISLDEGWVRKSYQDRLRDAHYLWRLWAHIYSPYEGWDTALVRLLDPAGRKIGGSKPRAGSQIYVQDN